MFADAFSQLFSEHVSYQKIYLNIKQNVIVTCKRSSGSIRLNDALLSFQRHLKTNEQTNERTTDRLNERTKATNDNNNNNDNSGVFLIQKTLSTCTQTTIVVRPRGLNNGQTGRETILNIHELELTNCTFNN